MFTKPKWKTAIAHEDILPNFFNLPRNYAMDAITSIVMKMFAPRKNYSFSLFYHNLITKYKRNQHDIGLRSANKLELRHV